MMANDAASNEWVISAFKAAGLVVLLISPLGAPLVGFAIISGCDIPWEGSFRCAVPGPVLDYFIPFTILPWAWVGPALAIVWLMLSLGLLIGCFWFAGKAIWQFTMERL